jgi:hypothetical protein
MDTDQNYDSCIYAQLTAALPNPALSLHYNIQYNSVYIQEHSEDYLLLRVTLILNFNSVYVSLFSFFHDKEILFPFSASNIPVVSPLCLHTQLVFEVLCQQRLL